MYASMFQGTSFQLQLIRVFRSLYRASDNRTPALSECFWFIYKVRCSVQISSFHVETLQRRRNSIIILRYIEMLFLLNFQSLMCTSADSIYSLFQFGYQLNFDGRISNERNCLLKNRFFVAHCRCWSKRISKMLLFNDFKWNYFPIFHELVMGISILIQSPAFRNVMVGHTLKIKWILNKDWI